MQSKIKFKSMNIAITGFMGTGKSLIGKLLARKMRWEYFDTDHIIELGTGLTIEEIFEQKGENHFRELELKTVRLVSKLDEVIISCGGGVVLRKENMEALEKKSFIVCLIATPEKIYDRIKYSNRPLLKVKDPPATIRKMLTERYRYYQRCNLMIDTSNSSPEETVEKICRYCKKLYLI